MAAYFAFAKNSTLRFLLRKQRLSLVDIFFVTLIFVLGILFFSIASLHYHSYAYTVGDTAVAQNALYNTLDGKYFFQPFLKAESNFREHITFGQILFLPFYWILPHTLTLYGIVIATYILCAVFFYFSFRRTTPFMILSISVLLFFLHPISLSQMIGPFHVAALAGSFFLLLLIGYKKSHLPLFLLSCVALFFMPEYIAPTLFLVGVYAFYEKKSFYWWAVPLLLSLTLWILARCYITIGASVSERISALLLPQNWSRIPFMDLRFLYALQTIQPVAWLMPLISRYGIFLLPSFFIILFLSLYARLEGGSHIVNLIPAITAFVFFDVATRYEQYRKGLVLLAVMGLISSIISYALPHSIAHHNKNLDTFDAARLYVLSEGSVTADTAVAPHLSNRTFLYIHSDSGVIAGSENSRNVVDVNKTYNTENLSDFMVLARDPHSPSPFEKSTNTYNFYDKVFHAREYFTLYNENGVYVRIKKEKLSVLLESVGQDFDELTPEQVITLYKENFLSPP